MIWIFLAILIVSLIVNKFFLKTGFSEIVFDMEIENPVVEIGEEVIVKTILENHKSVPIPYLEIKETYPFGLENRLHTITLLIKARERVIRRHAHKTTRRGKFTRIESRLSLGDFLGFKNEVLDKVFKKNIIVKPKKVALEDQIQPTASTQGDVSVKRWIIDDPLMISGVREYNTLDAQKLIHWPSSIRQGRLMVKKFDFTSDNSTLILLNTETQKPSPDEPMYDLIESSIITARSVCEELFERNIEYGFVTNAYNRISHYERGYTIASGLGDKHRDEVIELVGSLDYKPDMRYHKLITNIANNNQLFSSVILITPRILPEYVRVINDLTYKIPRVILITHTDENTNLINRNVMIYKGEKHD